MKEHTEIRAFLSARADVYGIPVDDFAEHVLRNYSLNQRSTYGANPIEQAYNVIQNNLRTYKDVK